MRATFIKRRVGPFVLSAAVFAAVVLPLRAGAEPLRIGLALIAAGAPVYIAQDKGYFAEQGLETKIVPMDSALAISMAVVSNDIDVGTTGISAGLYSLAGQGKIRIIGALARDVPGFQQFALVANNRAYAAGLKTYRDLAGHAVAIAQMGATTHYVLGRLGEKFGFDLKSVRVMALQTPSNTLSAITGGQVDAGIMPATQVMGGVTRDEIKLIGFTGDETPWQSGTVFTSTKMTDERGDTLKRFLAAYRKGTSAYHHAFIDADGRRKDQATAPEMLQIFARWTKQPIDQLERAMPYIDAEARLDVKDVLHQIAWFKSHNMLKEEMKGEEMIDTRYVVALPGE